MNSQFYGNFTQLWDLQNKKSPYDHVMECAVLRMGIYQAITQVALLVAASTTCSEVPQEEATAVEKWLPAGLARRSPAAPSTTRLPTLQPVIEKLANNEDEPIVKGLVSGVEVTFL